MSKSIRASGSRPSPNSIAEHSVNITNEVARLGNRSEAVLSRLQAVRPTDTDSGPHPVPAQASSPSDRMLRQHVVIVNSDPAFLDAARVILQGDRYNVTTTNLVPSTYEMIRAVDVDVLVIDLALDVPSIWTLVDQLRQGPKTRSLPIVFTATRPELLDRAQDERWRAGGRFVFLKPFNPQDLLDAVQSLIGDA